MSTWQALRSEGARPFLRRRILKVSLVSGDLVSLLLGTIIGHYWSGYASNSAHWHRALVVGVTATLGLWAIRAQGLFVARNVMMRVVELTKIAQACVLLALLLLLTDRIFEIQLHIKEAAAACAVAFVMLVLWRSLYRAALVDARLNGRFLRRTILIGGQVEVQRLMNLITTHRELGIDPLGHIGLDVVEPVDGVRPIGLLDDAERLVIEHGATGVVICAQGVPPERMNSLVRNLQADGVHVLIDPGIGGIEARRLRATSLAHEPLLWVQAPRLSRAQNFAKRFFDVTVSGLVLLAASPIMAVVAILVKRGDRGPVMFRQHRVGRYGSTFELLKFRTMHVDAEARQAALSGSNERSGPLFKMNDDPRVTRVGRWLRESSLDELPQLFNVLKGDMSLVGPRPALPREVEQFSAEVRARELVLPGITGLWQVEARDNPSFDAYRRLDQFYVENWTLTLDVFIVLATIEHIVVRVVKSLNRSQPEAAPSESIG